MPRLVQVAHQRAGMPLRVKDDGASGRSGISGSHPFGWRDAMDLLVKWRQLAEPNDQARKFSIDGVIRSCQVTACSVPKIC